MKIAILKNKNRNDSISIGALVIMHELTRSGVSVEICNYSTAFNYTHVLVSMTSTEDIYDIYKNCHKHNWNKRTFTAFVGGFGCQNPIALATFIDYAFFGRADGIILDYITNPDKYRQHSFKISNPQEVILRQVDKCYPHAVRYGKSNVKWTEKFIGCPFRCKFCHYSHNRKYVGAGTYVNDGLALNSPEVMIKDIPNMENRPGRMTTALDGYSERLRFLYGKKITWSMVEDALDHLAQFKGTFYLKLYNIHNFPTETEIDEKEFVDFVKEYVGCTTKADGRFIVDVFNTAFRPSLNTPMERMPVMLYPESHRDDATIIDKNGFLFKYTMFSKGARAHLLDVISIRYTNIDHIELISLYNELPNDIVDYLREYSLDEKLFFKWIK